MCTLPLSCTHQLLIDGLLQQTSLFKLGDSANQRYSILVGCLVGAHCALCPLDALTLWCWYNCVGTSGIFFTQKEVQINKWRQANTMWIKHLSSSLPNGCIKVQTLSLSLWSRSEEQFGSAASIWRNMRMSIWAWITRPRQQLFRVQLAYYSCGGEKTDFQLTLRRQSVQCSSEGLRRACLHLDGACDRIHAQPLWWSLCETEAKFLWVGSTISCCHDLNFVLGWFFFVSLLHRVGWQNDLMLWLLSVGKPLPSSALEWRRANFALVSKCTGD